jgi:formate dehydrogenase maturation protein FdhE
MACPHCGNADPSLLEYLGTLQGWRVSLCGVCAKPWSVKVEQVKVEASK